ncbi:transposable element Tcb1 transposase [Trichonephila clavipes]|uniref:Transposable element Tcb1 transposase n=1 Tax=Trichonephila clavipes TaxID=2585209 RepID=A0A8X6S863_TRICX|nr:transposable element Tcb1 transposase [Trichonephila clavipes]
MEYFERWRAVGRIKAGLSITNVALFFCIHHSVLSRLRKQFQTTQTAVRRLVGGRSRLTTPVEGRYIAIVAKRKRRATSTRVTSMVTASIEARLKGYREHGNWTVSDWGNVILTDESRFALEPDDKRIRIWRKQGTCNQPQNITEHHVFRGGSIMMWEGILLGYSTDMLILKQGSVTAVRYRDEVLDHIVRLYAAAVRPTFVLMDDNARPHGADIVDDCLESIGIVHMTWPTYSPDLNPIENLWDALDHAAYSCFSPPATLIELKTALQEEWRLLNLLWLTT